MKSVLGFSCLLLLMCCQVTIAKPSIIFLEARRCINMWDEGCINGQLPGAGSDNDFVNGGFNPGKRCLNGWDEDCHNGPISEGDNSNQGAEIPAGRRFLYELLEKMRKKQLY